MSRVCRDKDRSLDKLELTMLVNIAECVNMHGITLQLDPVTIIWLHEQSCWWMSLPHRRNVSSSWWLPGWLTPLITLSNVTRRVCFLALAFLSPSVSKTQNWCDVMPWYSFGKRGRFLPLQEGQGINLIWCGASESSRTQILALVLYTSPDEHRPSRPLSR